MVIWILTALYICLLEMKFKTCSLDLQCGQVQMCEYDAALQHVGVWRRGTATVQFLCSV